MWFGNPVVGLEIRLPLVAIGLRRRNTPKTLRARVLVAKLYWRAQKGETHIHRARRRYLAARFLHPSQQYRASALRHSGKSSPHQRQNQSRHAMRFKIAMARALRFPTLPVQKYGSKLASNRPSYSSNHTACGSGPGIAISPYLRTQKRVN